MAITLLPQEGGKARETLLSKRLRTIAFLSLFLYIAGLLGVGGFFFFVTNKRTQLPRTQETLTTEIQNQKLAESNAVLLKDRIATLQQVREGGASFRNVVNVTSDLAGSEPDLIVNDIAATDQRVQLTLSAADTFALERFLSRLPQAKSIMEATLESVTRTEVGEYIASIILKLQ